MSLRCDICFCTVMCHGNMVRDVRALKPGNSITT